MLTDSACDIPQELEKKYGIDILPFLITVDGKSYTEREDFTFEEYYDILTKCEGIPVTSQITMMRFEEKFEEYAAAGIEEVLYISINSSGSNTHNAAQMAARSFAESHPDSGMSIHIVDSHTYSMAYGYYVCEAARMLKNGADMKTVVDFLNDKFSSVEAVLSVYTLKYIKKSGRVSAAAAFAGELLGLRPVIELIDGVSTTGAKVRGDVNVMPGLIRHAAKRRRPDIDETYLVGATDEANIKMLSKLCKKEFGRAPDATFLIGAAVATNTGPNAVAIVYHGEKRR